MYPVRARTPTARSGVERRVVELLYERQLALETPEGLLKAYYVLRSWLHSMLGWQERERSDESQGKPACCGIQISSAG